MSRSHGRKNWRFESNLRLLGRSQLSKPSDLPCFYCTRLNIKVYLILSSAVQLRFICTKSVIDILSINPRLYWDYPNLVNRHKTNTHWRRHLIIFTKIHHISWRGHRGWWVYGEGNLLTWRCANHSQTRRIKCSSACKTLWGYFVMLGMIHTLFSE